MAKKKEDADVERARKNLGVKPKAKKKPTAWRLRDEGQLLCDEHVGEHQRVDVDKVTPKKGEACSICGIDLTTGEKPDVPAAAPVPHINRKNYDRRVFVKLEGPDREAAADELLAAMRELDRQEAARKEVMAEWKGIIGQAEEAVQAKRAVLENGHDEVVRVLEVTDWDAGTVIITREDNGAIVEQRSLTDGERQRDLEGLQDGDSAAAAGDLEAHDHGHDGAGPHASADPDPDMPPDDPADRQ